MNNLEQYSRRGNLRIFGLEVPKDVDCNKFIAQFCMNKLQVKMQDSDIASSHPIPARNNSSDSNKKCIIVRFANRNIRNLVLQARKKLKGSGISISEDLTVVNIDLLNRLKKDQTISELWSSQQAR